MIGPPKEKETGSAANISAASITDISSILDISKECGLSQWTEVNYFDELKRSDSVILIAWVKASEPVGFVVGRLILSDKIEDPSEAEIYNIGVRNVNRKLGTGTSLLGEFLNICSKNRVENVFLDVRASNVTAILFYGNCRFEKIAVRKHFYRDPIEDALIMRLKLPIS